MRQGPNSRRSRGRGGNNNRRQNNVPLRHQTFDSNGPDVRIRGNAFQIHEKYQALARDAQASGDRIAAENYQQHAEHYYRIICQINEQENRQRQGGNGRHDGNGHAHGDGDDGDDGDDMDAAEDDREQMNA